MSPPAEADVAINPRIRQRREQVERSRSQKRMRRLAAVLAVAALVATGIYLLHTPLFGAQKVTITGIHPNTSDQDIRSAAGLLHHPALISVDPGPAEARVETLPFIATAHITRHWPDSVTIAVTERKPAAVMAGPASRWSTLDGLGRTLAVTPAKMNYPALVVHLSTGVVSPAPVGSRAVPTAAVAPGLLVARTLPVAFSGQVTTVTVAADRTVTLSLTSGLVVVIGTASELATKYATIAAIIAGTPLKGMHTIDVSVPQSPTVGP